MGDTSIMEKNRIEHINLTMDELYNLLPQIYESLVDKDYEAVKKNVNTMMKLLKAIAESVEDEI